MNDSVRQRISVLQPLLKDKDPEVCNSAAEAIERLEGICALDEIMQSLKTGDTGAKIRAIYAMGEIGGDRVVAPLVYCAGRPEDGLRAAAVEVLGKITSPAVFPVLLERLDDVNGAIQARAIAALHYRQKMAASRDALDLHPQARTQRSSRRICGRNTHIQSAAAILHKERVPSPIIKRGHPHQPHRLRPIRRSWRTAWSSRW